MEKMEMDVQFLKREVDLQLGCTLSWKIKFSPFT